MTDLHPATKRQNDAADPGASTWLSANAGSGKTRVLTDRVARLLLRDVDPQNILCLTYTKAAASEMQNRLFRRLGAWAMLPDAALRAELADLGVTDISDLGKARTLFARAIETPGGLKIQTIHSFCSALLRRFPLEAGVSPQFAEMEDAGQAVLMGDVLERLAEIDEGGAISRIVAQFSGDDLGDLAGQVARYQNAFSAVPSEAEILAAYGAADGISEDQLLSDVRDAAGANEFRDLISILANGSSTEAGAAQKLRSICLDAVQFNDLPVLESVFLYGPKATPPFGSKAGKFPTQPTRKAYPALADAVDHFCNAVAAARTQRVALQTARNTLALQDFAAQFLPAYEAEKQRRGLLDFDDLITKSIRLLSDSSVAAWVLFRLDGGIDHILIDESQDTSPAQWKVIALLAGEFGAGRGARSDVLRTLFIVGDKKQSIYSFQGADAEAFDLMREVFRERLKAQGGMQSLSLEHSFRSARAILELVDATFEGQAGQGLGLDISHTAFHETMPGRVDLWQIVPKADLPDDGDWTDPVDKTAPNQASAVLAEHIAEEIHRLVKDPTATIPLQKGGRKKIDEGDILILVQGRSGSGDLFHTLIRACKARGLQVAGADRLRIGGELAVRDLKALMAFLALPEDSLSLAAALRSPFFGWSEADLFKLAAHRSERFLWEALRQGTGATQEILTDLLVNSDFLRPYELLERILVRHRGRQNLISRLGMEAEDGIDELLNQALAYERKDTPSLTGFLAWLEGEDVEIKRQLDTAGGRIRVMTVHGAKGLESPIVILPDTLRTRRARRSDVLVDASDHAHWKPPANEAPEAIKNALDAAATAEEMERNRLLYVAMTRAESWLIVCGAGEEPKKATTWYGTVRDGINRAGGGPVSFPTGEGLRFARGDWTRGDFIAPAPLVSHEMALFDAAQYPADPPQDAIRTLSPSDLGGAKALPGEPGASDDDTSLRRGRQIHRLLEHLPTCPEDRREALARNLLENGHDPVTPEETAVLIKQALGLLANPDLAEIFTATALTETDVTAELPQLNGRRIFGAIDRLIVSEDTVLVIDYKSNFIVPDRADDVPLGVLRQMGAYAAAMQQIYPDHRIQTAILWTQAAALMPLPDDIVMSSLEGATIS